MYLAIKFGESWFYIYYKKRLSAAAELDCGVWRANAFEDVEPKVRSLF